MIYIVSYLHQNLAGTFLPTLLSVLWIWTFDIFLRSCCQMCTDTRVWDNQTIFHTTCSRFPQITDLFLERLP